MSQRIAVVTPYYQEDLNVLRQCHESVLAQGVEADHLMIADGHRQPEVDGWQVQHVTLPRSHGDNGDTPRGIGGLLAKAAGYDFVAYLDADNWYHAEHLSSLVALHRQTGNPICTSLRTFHAPSGELLQVAESDEDALRHVDTSCFLIHRQSFDVLGVWLDMPQALSPICDRVFLAAVMDRGYGVRSSGRRTVAFRSRYASHYQAARAPEPGNAKNADFAASAYAYLNSRQGVTESVKALGFWPGSYLPAG